ncbi:hypothetical protein [uncultured Chryseobacterium sp.]|uniref:hypothetical protein n=1 Tax=uncultured Chryseobacterium sp. TaxID=259322 RepID=UPI0025DF529A|nr:hypothetical protein [uncultured Chryseobacterium sp.]
MKNLEAKMDEAFQENILFPREQTVIDFLVSVLNNPEKFREDGRKIEVIGLYYYAASPLSFLFAMPNYAYYAPDKTVHIAELHLKEHGFAEYTYLDLQELCKKVLDENDFSYDSRTDRNGLPDLSNYWENQSGLEHEFLRQCWKKAKEQTRSKILGFLEASDSSSLVYDLDNGFYLPFEVDLDEYLHSQGFRFEKES